MTQRSLSQMPLRPAGRRLLRARQHDPAPIAACGERPYTSYQTAIRRTLHRSLPSPSLRPQKRSHPPAGLASGWQPARPPTCPWPARPVSSARDVQTGIERERIDANPDTWRERARNAAASAENPGSASPRRHPHSRRSSHRLCVGPIPMPSSPLHAPGCGRAGVPTVRYQPLSPTCQRWIRPCPTHR